jgi:hypothetical protein
MRDIERVSTLPIKGIFAIMVRNYRYSKRIFRIGRHNEEKIKNIA